MISDIIAASVLKFRVYGTPKPGGSKTAFFNKKLNRSMVVEACKGNKQWRDSVASAAVEAMSGRKLFVGPIRLTVIFYKQRPLYHFDSNRLIKAKYMGIYPTTKPDLTKLMRSTEDALKSITWHDDSEVVIQRADKVYCPTNEPEGAEITIGQL